MQLTASTAVGERMTLATSNPQVQALEEFLRANEALDCRAAPLTDPAFLQTLRWPGPTAELVPLVKAYQRLVFVLPEGEERRALRMIERGLLSASQLASEPRAKLAALWEELFPGEAELGEQVRRAAVARKAQIALEHVKSVQSNEPHYRAARFR